jgi:hypothetical protein
VKQLLILIARGWQLGPSRLLPPTCRYAPSCSEYAIQAIGKYGALNGGPMDNLLLRPATAAMDQPTPLFTGDKVVPWPDGYNTDAYVGFEIDQPVNAVLVAIMPQIVTNDAR